MTGAGKGPDATARPRSLPEIDPDLCVHARLPTASCRACVDVCPHRALVLDGSALGIDTDACDGCAICRPSCPEQAIAFEGLATAPLLDVSRGVALVACERAGLPAGRGVVACVDALGEHDFDGFEAAGIERLMVARGDCGSCSRSTPATIEAALGRWSAVGPPLRAKRPLRILALGGRDWQRLRAQTLLAGNDLDQRRRALFGLGRRSGGRGPAPSRTTAAPETGHARYRHVPEIDAATCHACGACARICRHGAISITQGQSGVLGYAIAAEACTGCRLCIDVCDAGAVRINELAPAGTRFLPLVQSRCRHCGVSFATPVRRVETADDAAEPDLCRVCRATARNSRLFQVRRD